jgi:hypothetical protein
MKKIIAIILPALFLLACSPAVEKATDETSPIGQPVIEKLISQLTEKYGSDFQFRIERGVKQAASLWRNSDGSIEAISKPLFSKTSLPTRPSSTWCSTAWPTTLSTCTVTATGLPWS